MKHDAQPTKPLPICGNCEREYTPGAFAAAEVSRDAPGFPMILGDDYCPECTAAVMEEYRAYMPMSADNDEPMGAVDQEDIGWPAVVVATTEVLRMLRLSPEEHRNSFPPLGV